MSAEGIKPRASLNAGMMGGMRGLRRVPLSFVQHDAEPIAPSPADDARLPEVIRQARRLTRLIATPAETPVAEPEAVIAAVPVVARRVAFTLRIDPVRHRQLRALVSLEGRSAQQLLTDALDRYCAAVQPSSALDSTPVIHPSTALPQARLLARKQP